MKPGANLFIRLVLTIVFLAPSACASLDNAINQICSSGTQRNVQYGIHIVDADSGKTLYARNADEPMTPASNMKLITTAAALHYLGGDYTYETTVAIKDNTLVIIGSGDPLLGDKITNANNGKEPGWIFKDIAAALIHSNIDGVEDIIVDTTIFDDQLVHPSWPPAELNRWYACEVSGLNYHGNCVEITCHNRAGQIDVDIEPATNYLKITNKIRPISSGSGAVGAYRTEKINTVVLRGRCRRAQGPFRVAIERPAAFFAYLLAEELNRHNIKVTGKIYERAVTERANLRTLKTYTTPLTECLKRANKDSFGLAAEAMFKTIAANANENKNGSWKLGRELIDEYLMSLKIGPDKFYIDDGSGLSRKNKLSPDCITAVLKDMYESGDRQTFKESLAAGGIDGTISRYFKEAKYQGNIIGKTGYISGVRTFSGYCFAGERTFIFSILTNNSNGTSRSAINDIAKAVIDNAP